MPITPGLDTMLGSATPATGGATVLLALTALTDTATLSRKTRAADGIGTQQATWGSNGTAACALQKTTTYEERLIGGKLQGVTLWMCHFALDADLLPPDKVTINGQQYQVLETDQGMTNPLFLTARLMRLR